MRILKDHYQLESSASQSAKLYKHSARSGRLLHFESTKPVNLHTFFRRSWFFIALRDFLYLLTCRWAATRVRGRPWRWCGRCVKLQKAFLVVSLARKTFSSGKKDSKEITELEQIKCKAGVKRYEKTRRKILLFYPAFQSKQLTKSCRHTLQMANAQTATPCPPPKRAYTAQIAPSTKYRRTPTQYPQTRAGIK